MQGGKVDEGRTGMKLESLSEPILLEQTEVAPYPSWRIGQFDLFEILTILRKRRKFILWFTSASAILTTIIVFLIPNKYTATTVLLPPQQNSSISSALMSQLAGSNALTSLAGSSLGIKNPSDMYVSLFRSRTVEDSLIRRFQLMARYHKKTMYDTRKYFEEYTTVTLGVKDGLIYVEVIDRDPIFASQLANAYVDEFHKHSDALTITEASRRREFFQQQLLQANGDLTNAEDALKRTQQSTGVLQFDSQAKALIESAAVLRGQITAKEVQLQSIQSFATPNNPQYVVAQRELDALKAQLAKVIGPGGSAGSDIGVSRSNVPQAAITYLNSLRDVRYYETYVELLTRQLDLAKLDESRQGTVQVSDIAIPPDKKSSPHRALIVILASLVALITAGLWVLGREAIHDVRERCR